MEPLRLTVYATSTRPTNAYCGGTSRIRRNPRPQYLGYSSVDVEFAESRAREFRQRCPAARARLCGAQQTG